MDTPTVKEGQFPMSRLPVNSAWPGDWLAMVMQRLAEYPSTGPDSIKRDMALALLQDPDLRLRMCHLEDIVRLRQFQARQAASGTGESVGAGGLPALDLRSALSDPAVSSLFILDASLPDQAWAMQVVCLNTPQLLKELNISPPQRTNSGSTPHTPHGRAPPMATQGSSSSFPGAGSSTPPPPPPEPHLLSSLEAAFPAYATDDDSYMALASSYCLASRREGRAHMPPYTLHLTDLVVYLRACAAGDGRLSSLVQRLLPPGGPAGAARAGGRSGGGAAPGGGLAVTLPAMATRLCEVLGAPRMGQVFRVGDSPSRKGEKVLTLAVEQLPRQSPNGPSSNPYNRTGRPLCGVPLDAWQQAVAAMAAAASGWAGSSDGGGGGEGSGSGTGMSQGGLPNVLFEYEGPGDMYGRDDMAAAGGAHRDQYGGGDGRGPSPAGGSHGGRASALQPAASAPLPAHIGMSPQHSSSQQHVMDAAAFQRYSSSSLDLGHVASGSSAYGASTRAVSTNGVDTAGLANLAQLGMAGAWGHCAPLDGASFNAGGSHSNSGLPNFSRLSSNSTGNGMGPSSACGRQPTTMEGAMAAVMGAAAAALGASPGGMQPGADAMHVPREIASVWANAGGAGGGPMGQQQMAALMAAAAAEAQHGVFAMSPPAQDFSWDRAVAQLTALGSGPGDRPGSSSDPAQHGYMPGMVVGSAPGMLHAYASGNGRVSAAGGGLMGGSGLGGIGAQPGGGGEYLPWPASSPDFAGPVNMGGRSVPGTLEDHGPAGSWLLAHGARASQGCGGGASRNQSSGGNGNAPGGGQEHGAAAGGAAGSGGGVGPGGVASVSEDSEEASSVAGGPLDPLDVGLTLEAVIGYDPAGGSLTDAAAARRALLAAQDASNPNGAAPPHGSIAAAVAAATAKSAGENSHGPRPSFATVAGGHVGGPVGPSAGVRRSSTGPAPVPYAGGSSCNSSVDSAEQQGRVLTGLMNQGAADHAALVGSLGALNMSTAAALHNWSAMAARSAQAQQLSALGGNAILSGMGSVGALGTSALGTSLGADGAYVGLQRPLAHSMPGMGMGALGLGALSANTLAGMTAAAAAAAAGGGGLARDPFGGKMMHPRLTPRVREEIGNLLRCVPGLKPDDFDDGVLHQLTLKKSEEEAVGALRMLAADNGCGLAGIQHMAAYINHVIKNYHHGQPGLGAGAMLPSATVRANSTPVSSKAILQKLPLRVYKRLEEMIATCSYMEWKHFDAGVVKVMAQLAEISEDDVFEELELLKSTDLSNVEYMPAYLNKRLNNRLWSRRKMLTSSAGGM